MAPPAANVIPFTPRRLVVDASVVIKWYVDEEQSPDASALEHFRNTLLAPEFLAVELANIVWKKARKGEITVPQATMIVAPETLGQVELHADAPMTPEAYTLATELDHPVYDCLYLACARLHDGLVVTADDRFVRAVDDSPYATLVRPLAAPLPG